MIPTATPKPGNAGVVSERGPFHDGGVGSRLIAAMERALPDYVWSPDDGGDYFPSEFERGLLADFFMGLTADSDFCAALIEAQDALNRLAQQPGSGAIAQGEAVAWAVKTTSSNGSERQFIHHTKNGAKAVADDWRSAGWIVTITPLYLHPDTRSEGVTEAMVDAALAAQPHNSPVSYFLNPDHYLSNDDVRELMRAAIEAALSVKPTPAEETRP